MTFTQIKSTVVITAQCCLLLLLSSTTQAAELSKNIVKSNGHSLILWHKQSAVATPSKQIILLHGRTWSSLPDFDLQVEGEQLSLMDNLTKLGFSVWALDARGYGETKRDASGWLNPNKAAADVANVMKWVANKTGVKPTLFGWSYGSMTAQLSVQQNPDLAKALILFGYPIDPEKIIKPTLFPTKAPAHPNTGKNAASDFIVQGSISQKAIETYVEESLKADPYRADWNQLEQWNQLEARKVKIPALLMQAEHDPLADSESHGHFFVKLPNANKQWVVLAGADHAALLEITKDKFVHTINDFVEWLDK